MWLSGQQKRPPSLGEGQTGTVTMAGSRLAVQLDSEVRDPDLCTPGGYRWTPSVGDRVLVIKGEGEPPCIVGTCGGSIPNRVQLQAEHLDLVGEITVNGIPLEEYIRQVTGEST